MLIFSGALLWSGPQLRERAAMLLHDDRLFPADPVTRGIARRLYATVRNLPIVSPHGHTDPRWFAENEAFPVTRVAGGIVST